MVLSSSEFRKKLFTTLDSALKGEFVEVTYKGSSFRIVPNSPLSSKLARARKQDIFNVPPESIVNNDEFMQELEREWEEEARELGLGLP